MGNELYHHGIIGMKWGVRRYQNKDGTLTRAGEKRYSKELEKVKSEQAALKNKKATAKMLNKLDRERAKRDKLSADYDELSKGKSTNVGDRLKDGKKESNASKSSDAPKPKKFSEMTDEELTKAINRMDLEKRAIEAQTRLAALQPKQVTRGEQFVEGMKFIGNQYLVPFAMDSASKAVDAAIKKASGADVSSKEVSARLKREAEDLRNKKSIQQDKDWFDNRKRKMEEAAKKAQEKGSKSDKNQNGDKPGTIMSETKYDDVKRSPQTNVGQRYMDSLLGNSGNANGRGDNADNNPDDENRK